MATVCATGPSPWVRELSRNVTTEVLLYVREVTSRRAQRDLNHTAGLGLLLVSDGLIINE